MEFTNKNKILPNTSVCKPNYSQTKAFVDQPLELFGPLKMCIPVVSAIWGAEAGRL